MGSLKALIITRITVSTCNLLCIQLSSIIYNISLVCSQHTLNGLVECGQGVMNQSSVRRAESVDDASYIMHTLKRDVGREMMGFYWVTKYHCYPVRLKEF